MADATAITAAGAARAGAAADSIECRASWVAAALTTAVLAISYGAPLIVVIGLKPIAASLGAERQTVALAGALVWVGTGMGGIMMGWIADRVGVRLTVIFGAVMVALGLAVSSIGQVWALFIGHAVLIGLLGNAAHFPPLVVYVSRWFDRRRGTAVALISSGQYIAGMVWPTVFERGLTQFGWQATMLGYAVVVVAAIVPSGVVSGTATGTRAEPDGAYSDRGAGAPAHLGAAGERGAGPSVRGGVFVLRADGDAGWPSGRVLQRHRHRAGARSGDAVGAARLRLC